MKHYIFSRGGATEYLYIVITAIAIIVISIMIIYTLYERAKRLTVEDTSENRLYRFLENVCAELMMSERVAEKYTFEKKVNRERFLDVLRIKCFGSIRDDNIEILNCGAPHSDKYTIIYCGRDVIIGEHRLIFTKSGDGRIIQVNIE